MSNSNLTIYACFYAKLFLFCLQVDEDQFCRVIEADGDYAVAQATADDHGGIAFVVQACVIVREEAMAGSIETAQEGYTNLSAMHMASQH